MITFEQALGIARARIAEYGREDFAVNLEAVAEHPCGWIFPYNTKKYLETKFPPDGVVGNRPIFVDRHDGSAHVIPLGSKEEWLKQYALSHPR